MIKRIRLIIVVLAAGIIFCSFVMAGSVFMVGNDLINGLRFLESDPSSAPNIKETYNYGFYRGYTLGVYESWGFMSLHPDLKLPDAAANMTTTEFWFIVDKYLRTHPDDWNRTATDLIWSAVNDAFPKRLQSDQASLTVK